MNDLTPFYEPKSIALTGASAKELSIGNVITITLLHFKFPEPVYPINPKANEINSN